MEGRGLRRAEACPAVVGAQPGAPGGNAATAWKRQEGFLPSARRCGVRATPLGEAGDRECDALITTLRGLFLLLIQSNCWFPSLLLTYRIPVVASVVLIRGKCSLHPGAGGQSAHHLRGQGCRWRPECGARDAGRPRGARGALSSPGQGRSRRLLLLSSRPQQTSHSVVSKFSVRTSGIPVLFSDVLNFSLVCFILALLFQLDYKNTLFRS